MRSWLQNELKGRWLVVLEKFISECYLQCSGHFVSALMYSFAILEAINGAIELNDI